MIEISERSPLLVFAVGGRLGSGCSFVRDWLTHSLATFGYEVEVIDVSGVFLEHADKFLEGALGELSPPPFGLSEIAQRVRKLQASGDELRRRLGSDIIAALCVNEVITPHVAQNQVLVESKRQAYIIDSLKHPDEILFLRRVFREAFCMIGVVASDRVRMRRLRERKGFDDQTFRFLDHIDANEPNMAYGQKSIDAVIEADYFFANDFATKAEIQNEAERLMRLIFGVEIQSPRRDEVGMQAAHEAAKRSACLSRQVGAAVFDRDGQILTVGHNDVPQFGGGLYGPESIRDERCYARGGKCYNDAEKTAIVDDLVKSLRDAGVLRADVEAKVVEQVIWSTRIKHLIEFSRAVHAEMDALVGLARSGQAGVVGSTLFCTTFPCHNCAKHIIDAGIVRVVYLEPYEKSLARALHADAISAPEEEQRDDKVAFDLYGGVSPTRFADFFGMRDERKKNGKFIDRDRSRASLTPMGAQEIAVLQKRLECVTEQVEKLVVRVDVEDVPKAVAG